jgi:DNA polymerase III subunit alpha
LARSFVHLHVHTEYSMLDGASRIGDVVAAAAADGQPAIGITDHGNMYGVLPMYSAARAAGITPIIGTELYQAYEHRTERPARRSSKVDDSGGEVEGGRKAYYHLTALAENQTGYRNLIQLSSRAYLEGYHQKPKVDWELLEAHHEGIIATTGCLGGQVLQALLKEDEEGARQIAGRLQDIFGRDNLFVELQDHGIPEQHRTNPKLMEIARAIDAPVLATNDSHYTHQGDSMAHDALLCVQTNAKIHEENRFKFHGDQHYLKSAAEMRSLFSEVPEACDSTLWIAERANVDLEFGNPVLPSFPVPEGQTETSYLRELTMDGVRERYGNAPGADVLERIEYELGVIESMGFSAYFLVVWDLVRYAKSRGIRVGPGRGSAAGSCVAYCLRIVDIDPIRYDLLFERFLNPGRKQMPDIDMDFDSRYRGEMIKYAAQRYGADHVAQIVTFSTIKARAAVRDAARVLDYPYVVGDKIAKLMPPLIMGRDTPLHACFEQNPKFEDGYKMAADLRELYGSDPDAKRVIDVAKGLEGLRRQDGIHAAAVVITREPLTEYLPVQRKPEPGGSIEDAPIVTQYEMHGVEDLGLLKMDFLGLRNLDVIEITLDLIEADTGTRLNIDDIPLDDPKTFDLLRAGDTIGVFQLEGGPMRALIRSVAPNTFEDVSAVLALYRPGPMAQNWHNEYADRKNGRKPITFPHPALEEVLAPTYGLMVYQEQLMRVSQQLAGYSLEDADNLRKATGKKIRELLAKERTKFVDGCVGQGHERAFGEQMFDTIEPFADYSFNKSHTVGYGLVTWQTAYLKANHPHEYLAALLTSVKGDKDKSAVYLNECRQLDIPVLVPDINESDMDFAVRNTATGVDVDGAPAEVRAIRFGLSAVRNVGEGVVGKLIEARDEGGPFVDFYDLCERVDPAVLNKRTIESLIKAGAFDSLGHPRQGLFLVFEGIIENVMVRRRKEAEGQFDLFGSLDDPDQRERSGERTPILEQEFTKSQRLAFEKEMLGLYVSDHPLMGAERALRRHADTTLTELKELREGEMRTVGGVVTALARKYTKRGDLMATFVLEDLGGAVEVMVFPKTMAQFGELLAEDAIVCVKARIDLRDEAPKLIAMEITAPPLAIDGAEPVRIRARAGALNDDKVAKLKEVLHQHPGESEVLVYIANQEKTTVVSLGHEHSVNDSNGLFAELRVLLGEECILAPEQAQALISRS